MSNFHNWEDVLASKNLKKAVRQYAIEQGEIEKGGRLPSDESELQDLYERAIIEEGDVVFYFSNDSYPNGPDVIYLYCGKYFLFWGDGTVDSPYDDLTTPIEVMFDLLDHHDFVFEEESPVDIHGKFDNEYILNLVKKHTTVGKDIKVNDKFYVLTDSGFVLM